MEEKKKAQRLPKGIDLNLIHDRELQEGVSIARALVRFRDTSSLSTELSLRVPDFSR